MDGKRRSARGSVDSDVDEVVPIAVVAVLAGERCHRNAARLPRAIAGVRKLEDTAAHRIGEFARLRDRVDEPPVLRALSAHPFGHRAEDVGQVVAHLALVGEAREAAGAGQDAEERNLRQRNRRRTVVDEPDLVAGERQLVAAAGARPVDRGDELEPGVGTRILHPVARFVGELAEVDLPGVRGQAEHEDVGARAEHAVLGARDDDAAHFRMLEADPLQRVGQLDVDAQVVRIELELVSLADAGVLGDVHRKARDRPFEREPPVPVACRIRAVVDLDVRHASSIRKMHDNASIR